MAAPPEKIPDGVLEANEEFFQERKAETADGEYTRPKRYTFPQAEAPSEGRIVTGGGRRIHHAKPDHHKSE